MTPAQLLEKAFVAHVQLKGRKPEYFLVEPRLWADAAGDAALLCPYAHLLNASSTLVFNGIPLYASYWVTGIEAFSYPREVL